MNRLSTAQRVAVVRCLTEGLSIRSTVRMTGVAKNTITKLLLELGAACSAYQHTALVNLPCKRVQADEIWSFVGSKDANVPADKAGVYGSVWTWTAICADTKLCVSYLVSDRSPESAYEIMMDVASRLRNRVQLTTDGNKSYLEAVETAFGGQIDYAQLIKTYGSEEVLHRRYSPPVVQGTEVKVIAGRPDPKHIATSFVERQNLTMRMSMRRFTRLTNAFSKKAENHAAAVALYFMFYNFARVHQTLRVTPAMEAGVANHVWTIEEIVALLD